jgi:site-specific recombinase XerD
MDPQEVAMLTFYIESELRRRWVRQSPVGMHVDGFADWLRAAGYKRRPGQLVLRGAAHLAHWTSARGVPLDRIDAGVLASFAGHLRTCACRHPFRGRDRYHRDGARRLTAYLRGIGVVPPACGEPETVSPMVTRFRQWMRQHRGVTESTLATYVPLVTEFLAAQGADAAAFDAAGVRAFILARASRHGRSRAKSIVNAIRMFLRFLAVCGHCSPDLVAAVPRIAEWKLSSLPRYISADAITRLCAACDTATAVGARDRAIILLLARLGLRAGDVRNLCLTDIDWAHGRLRVMGKGRCETWLPLPQDAGDAVLHYLTRARPNIHDNHVFLRVYAPLGPLPSSGPISKVVRRALQRAAIDAPSMGAHVLRHSATTDLLRQGVSLDVIGAVLRHRCIESTAHYAKVDVAALQLVAQPWGAPC